jgi:hypothetical protein
MAALSLFLADLWTPLILEAHKSVHNISPLADKELVRKLYIRKLLLEILNLFPCCVCI